MERIGFAAGKKHGTALHREPHLFSDPPAARKGFIILFLSEDLCKVSTAGSTFPVLEEVRLEILYLQNLFQFVPNPGTTNSEKIPASLFKVEQRYQFIFFEGRRLGEKISVSGNFNFWNVTLF